jgi:hypothetical protein
MTLASLAWHAAGRFRKLRVTLRLREATQLHHLLLDKIDNCQRWLVGAQLGKHVTQILCCINVLLGHEAKQTAIVQYQYYYRIVILLQLVVVLMPISVNLILI